MSIALFNRCVYGSRLYSHVRPDSDHDYLDIVADEDIEQVHALSQQPSGVLRYRGGVLPDFVFTDAFFRQRDMLYFFENPALQQSVCVLTRSHYTALIKANCLWVLEILFAPDHTKRFPESLMVHHACNLDYLRAAFKFEADFAIGKGIHFERKGLPYKAHKNYYFAHRFAVFAHQLAEHGAIIDHEEPVRRFYLHPHTRSSAVQSLRAYVATIPALAGTLSYADMPVRVAPPWATIENIDVRDRPRNAPLLTVPGREEIVVNHRAVPLTDGVLTRQDLLRHNLSPAHLSILHAFGAVRYLLGRAPLTPAARLLH